MRSFWFISSLGALVLFSAAAVSCGSRIAYSPPSSPPSEESTLFQASFDDTWSAVIQTFFEKNIPVRTLEKASGILESDELHGELGRDCDCGTYLGLPVGGYGGAYGGDAYYRFRVLVEKRGDRETRLILRSSCRARAESVEGELVCRLFPGREQDVRSAIAGRLAAMTRASEAPKSQP